MAFSARVSFVLGTVWLLLFSTLCAARPHERDARHGHRDPHVQAYRVKDINSAVDGAAGSAPGPFVAAGGAVFFGAKYGLWRTDGTAPGAGWSTPLDITRAGRLVYFSAGDHTSGRELWAVSGRTVFRALHPGGGGPTAIAAGNAADGMNTLGGSRRAGSVPPVIRSARFAPSRTAAATGKT